MNAAEAFFDSKDRNVFIPTAQAVAALDALDQGLSHALPMVLLTGDAGMGKSAVVREAVARWVGRVHAAWLDVTAAPASAYFPNTIRLFGGHVRAEDKRPEFVGRLAHALTAIGESARVPLLLVEDAHLLDDGALAELGRIESAAAAADLPFKLILVGRSELLTRIVGPSLAAFSARIGVRVVVGPFEPDETRDFIARHFGPLADGTPAFTTKASQAIHDASRGVAASIGVLADEALRCAHAAELPKVSSDLVRAMIAAESGTGVLPEGLAPLDEDDGPDEEAKPKSKKSAKPATKSDAKAAPQAKATPSGEIPVDRRAVIPEKPAVIAAHKPPVTPPKAVAHKPPPATRPPSASAIPAPDLDSAHPRVRDWVSRFTDGQPPVRFGGRGSLPANEPAEMFPLDSPPPSASTHDAVAKAAADSKSAAEAAQRAAEVKAVEKAERAAEAKAEAQAKAIADSKAAADAKVAQEKAAQEKAAEDAKAAAEAAKRAAQAKAAAEARAAEEAAQRAAQAKAEAEAKAAEEANAAAEAAKRAAEAKAAEDAKAAAEAAKREAQRAEEASREVEVIEIKPEQLTPPELVLDVPPAPGPLTPTTILSPTSAKPLSRKQRRSAERRAQREARRAVSTPQAAPIVVEAKPPATLPDEPKPPQLTITTKPVAPPSAPSPPSAEIKPPQLPKTIARPAPAPPAASRPAPPAASRPAPPAASRKVPPPASAPVQVERRGARLAQPKPPVEPAKQEVSAPQTPYLESGERTADNSGPPMVERLLAALIPIVLILGMAIAAIILSRRGAFDRPREPVAATPSSTQAPAPPSPETTPAPLPESDASTKAPAVDQPVLDTPAVQTPVVDTPVVAPPPEAPAPSPPGRFCLAVGTYLFEERATEKAHALTRSSGHRAWVDMVVTTDSRSYRVLVGAFATEADAERAADRMLSKGLVTEALVENRPESAPGR